jgi:hypothetical protein
MDTTAVKIKNNEGLQPMHGWIDLKDMLLHSYLIKRKQMNKQHRML